MPDYVLVGDTLLTAKPSQKLQTIVSQLNPIAAELLRQKGAQATSCHNVAALWYDLLRRTKWAGLQIGSGAAVLEQPIWHEAFGQWMTFVPHVWVIVRDVDGRRKIVDGSVAQFKGQIPKYLRDVSQAEY
jgi:hypothetical protein